MQLITAYLLGLLLILAWLWGSVALYIAGPESRWLRYSLILIFICSLPVILLLDTGYWQKGILYLLVFTVLFAWWLSLKPSNDKDWAPEINNIPFGEIDNGILLLHNVRNFRYKSRDDFIEHWETRRYDLGTLETLDIFFSYWGSPHIAHVIMSWGFADGQYLAVSVETRKVKSQTYSKINGFFKQFTLAYVAADERDVIRLRTNYRKEEVYGYRIINIPLNYKRYLLESYLQHMNKLVDEPEFYHVLLQNCVSGISRHYKTFLPNRSWIDWRLIANGHMDKLLYDLGLIDVSLPFADLKKRSRVDLHMQTLGEDNFSARLRETMRL